MRKTIPAEAASRLLHHPPEAPRRGLLATRACHILSDVAAVGWSTARLFCNTVLFGKDLLKNVAQEAAPLVGRVVVSAVVTGASAAVANYSGYFVHQILSDVFVGSLSVAAGVVAVVASKVVANTITKQVGTSEFPIMSHRMVDGSIRWLESAGTTFIVLFSKQVMWNRVYESADEFLYCPQGRLIAGERMWRWSAALLSIPIFAKNCGGSSNLKFKCSTLAAAIVAEAGIYLTHYCMHLNNNAFFCFPGAKLVHGLARHPPVY